MIGLPNAVRSLAKELIEPARRGETVFALALSEERGGSDAMGVDTIAVKDGSRWILNGKKCWITNAGAASGYIVTAKSPSAERSRCMSMFYVSKGELNSALYTNFTEKGYTF